MIGRRRRRLEAFLGYGVASMMALSCAPGRDDPPEPGAVPADDSSCPAPVLPPSAGIELVDSRLADLGGGVHGHEDTYRDERGELDVVVGYDPAEPLEDLDFEITEVAGERSYELATTAIAPEMVIVTWVDERFEEPCDEWAVFGRGFSVAEVLLFADGIEAA